MIRSDDTFRDIFLNLVYNLLKITKILDLAPPPKNHLKYATDQNDNINSETQQFDNNFLLNLVPNLNVAK